MKISKKKLSAVEQFQIDMQKVLFEYYSRSISENVKRYIRASENKGVNS